MIEVPIEMEVSTSYQPKTGSGSDLPYVTVDDNGKILKVINGEWNKGDETKELPDVTQQDDGKVLKVSNGAWTVGQESSGGSDLPEVTSQDNGEVLTVVDGEWAASDIPTELPSVSNTDNGKVLTVVDGEWNKANVPSSSELPDITQEDDGKILRVVNGQWAKSTESSGGLSNDIKDALLNLFQVVAYTVANSQEYYEALENALYPKNLVSISAVFTQGANVIYDTDSLDDLRQYLVVTAHYDDETSETISAYTLSGNLIAGTSTITVTYQNKTTTFDVNVTHVAGTCSIANSLVGCTTSNSATSITEGDSYTATITALAGYTMIDAQVEITMNEVDITSSAYSNGIISIGEVTGNLIITVTAQAITLSSISAVYTQVGTVYTTDNINNFKSNLVVTAHYSDSSEAEIASANYTLSGTLTVGTSVITVSYGGKTTTFNVIVSEPVVLSSISAVYTPDGKIFEDTPLVSLKDNLVVTALYSDNTSSIVNANDYTLSGTLQEGTSTIVVTYQNKTTTFNVTVIAVSSITATYTQSGVVYDDASLDSLKSDLVVTATYSDSSTAIVTDYTLSGTLQEGTSTITVTYDGKTDTFSVTVTHRLIPSTYQQVEYIASDGSAHFEIRDLNYPVGTVYKVKMFQTQRDTVNNRVAVGCLTSDTKYLCIGYKRDANNVGGFHYWDGCWVTLTKAYTEPSTVTLTSTSSSISVVAENTTESQNKTIQTQEAVTNVIKLGMFWDNRDANALVGRIYDVEVKNGNTTLSHFVPCYRISDNEIGMYETVSGVFYTSNTGTSFTKGGNV